MDWENEVDRVGWSLKCEEEVEKDILREMNALYRAEEAYINTLEEQER